MDPFGRPTGGSKNATETKLEILRIRHKVRSGQEEKPKVQEGLEQLKIASEAGNLDAKVALANSWFEGDLKESMTTFLQYSTETALQDCEEAASELHPDALFNLAILYYSGVHVPQNGKQALMLLSKAGTVCKDPSALFWLGQYYMHGDLNIDPDFKGDEEKGNYFIMEAVEAGHPKAQVYAALYNAEKGDKESAKHCLQMALDQEDPEALYLCGDLHTKNGSFYGNPNVDYSMALRLFERAGVQGHTEALCNAGALHFNGLGTEKNHYEAYRCYEQAARLGSLVAYKNIASMHFHGDGPLKKNIEAAKEIMKAVELIEMK